MTRSSLLEVLREDYVRTARAKGVLEKVIVNRHALKNAMLPVVTVIGIEFAFLMGGLVVTEQVFNLNGLGRLLVDSNSTLSGTVTLNGGRLGPKVGDTLTLTGPVDLDFDGPKRRACKGQ